MMVIRPIQLVACIFISLHFICLFNWMTPRVYIWMVRAKAPRRNLDRLSKTKIKESEQYKIYGKTCEIKAVAKVNGRPSRSQVYVCVCVWEREERDRETRLPQQLCHYVGGNYESDENGEGERIGAKAPTLEHERICQLERDPHICGNSEKWASLEQTGHSWRSTSHKIVEM